LLQPEADRKKSAQTWAATNLCHVFWALAVILIAFATFTVIVVSLRRPVRTTEDSNESLGTATPRRRIDLDQLKGFIYVGAVALTLLAIAVIVMGLFANRSGRAEGVAVLGLFGYAAYLGAATLVLYVMSRKS
jgi:hypothetical protein